MTTQIKPGAFLRRGSAGVAPETLKWLAEHPDELEAVCDTLDGRRDAALGR